MIKVLCMNPACHSFAVEGHKLCEVHLQESKEKQKQYEAERRPFRNAVRRNTAFYRTTEWKQIRNEVLEAYNNKCCLCGKTAEESGHPLEIHHKIPPAGNPDLFFDSSNCVPLCKEDHARITQKETEERKQH